MSRSRTTLAAAGLAWTAARAELVALVAATAVIAAVPVSLAWLTKLLIDDLTRPTPTTARTLPVVLALVAAGLLTAAAPRVANYLRTEIDRDVALVAQDRLFSAVEALPGLARLEDPEFLDRLRLAQHSGADAPSRLVDSALEAAGGALTIGGFLGALIVISPWMAVLVLAGAVPVVVGQLALAGRRAAMMAAISGVERREYFYAMLLSNVAAAKELRLFQAGPFLRGRMLDNRRTANVARRSMDRRDLVVQGGLALLSAVVAGAGLLWAVASVVDHHMTIGDISVFVAAVGGVQLALLQATASVALARQDLVLFGHFLEIVGCTPDLVTIDLLPRLPDLRHGIELRDVWFRYADDLPWVLSGVDLFLPYGQAVALVGRNGAGKSTLVKLLCRFYDPTRGSILWDGVDLRQVPVADLRGRLGAVFQDFMHYDLSAADNIGLGDVGLLADRTAVRAAAEAAGIDGVLAGLPNGYDTLLTRMFFSEADKADVTTGVVLSEGQWQRLALARALLRGRRDLLILDEPSSGLDAAAEADLHQRLRRHRSGSTSLLISHRLGAVRDADLIVTLRDGRVVEQGTHDQLLRSAGDYASLFTLQAQGYQPALRTAPVVG